MFSIVIPLYNKEISILQTLASVLEQSLIDFEIIVVNDGSSDNSRNVVRSFEDRRIRIIDKPNGGVSSARNRGIIESNFQWIVFLDADDVWEPFHLATLAGLIQKFPNDKVFCTSYRRSTDSKSEVQDHSIEVIDDYFKAIMESPFFWTSVTCIHESVFRKVGHFSLGYSRGEDVELWNKIGREYRFIKSNLITATYNIESENKLTRAKYQYRTSTLYSVHKRIEFFRSQSEKRYYLNLLAKKQAYFFKRMCVKYGVMTLYRYLILRSKKVLR